MSDIGFKPDFRFIGEPKPIDIVERLRLHNDTRLYQAADILMGEAADEIESLRKSVEYWKKDSAAAWDKCEERRLEAETLRTQLKDAQAHERVAHMRYAEAADEIESLREEKELLLKSIDGYSAQLAECQKERMDHELSLKIIESRDAYRNSVIEECVEAGRKASLARYASPMFVEQCAYNREQMVEAIRALKKGE